MDLKEYFRETDGKPRWVQDKVRGQGAAWQHHKLLNYTKPTIAMVNGWCFGGAFVPLVSCDIAIAAEDAVYAKHDQAILFDEAARTEGIKGFLDDKSYRPGLGTYDH